MMNVRVVAFGMMRRLWGVYLALFATAFTALVGISVMVEMVYHRKLNEALGPTMTYWRVEVNTDSTTAWMGAGLLALIGIGLFEVARRQFVARWSAVQDDIEAETRRRDAL